MKYLKTSIDYNLIIEDLTVDYDEIVFDVDDLEFYEHGEKEGFLRKYLYWEISWYHTKKHDFIERMEDRVPHLDIENINKGVLKLIKHLENNPDTFSSKKYNVHYIVSELKLLVKIDKYLKKILVESLIYTTDQYGRDSYDWKTGTDPIALHESKNN